MKNSNLILIILLLVIVDIYIVSAQETTPLISRFQLDEDYIVENYVYVKDINGELDKYIGSWKGTLNGNSYEFQIEKHTDEKEYYEYRIDVLILKYKIVDSNGKEIANTLTIDAGDDSIVYGLGLYDNGKYRLTYAGEQVYVVKVEKLL